MADRSAALAGRAVAGRRSVVTADDPTGDIIQPCPRIRKAGMDFDIAEYKRRTARLDIADLDLASFAERPLDPDTLRCLRYMHDVEFHTVCYLRDLLLTPAHRDPEVTAFLTFWSFEEFWHGEAIAAVLNAHGEASGDQRLGIMRKNLPWKDRLAPFSHLLGSIFAGTDYTAVHMVWGAINEWCTQAGYSRLSQRAGHPELSRLLARIMKQEGRHIDFYATQAGNRLASSRRAQKLARFALRKFWTPVGAGVMPKAETDFVIQYLFGDDDGRATAQRIDRRVGRFPGLGGLQLVQDVVAETVAA
jgi:hypothetical protein